MARPIKTSITLALAVPAALTAVLSSPASATTLTVGPGDSIQAAINAAHPGDTITVAAGTYRENIEITTDDITLQGAGTGGRGTLLKPPANPRHNDCYKRGVFAGICVFGQVDAQHNIVTPVSGVTITGFRVQGFNSDGVRATGAAHMTITGDRLVNNAANGVAAYAGTLNTISNNTATGSGDAGFLVADSPAARTHVDDNEASDNAVGVYVRDAFAYDNSTLDISEVNRDSLTGNCVGLLFLNTPAKPATFAWNAYANRIIANNKYCPSIDGFPVALSGTGLAIIGGNAIGVRDNTVDDNVSSVGKLPYSGGVVVAAYPGPRGTPVDTSDFSYNLMFDNKPYDFSYDNSGYAPINKGGFGTGVIVIYNNCDTSLPRMIANNVTPPFTGKVPVCYPTPVSQDPGYPGF